MECETSGAKKPSLPPPVRNPPLALIQTEKRRRGPDSLPPTPQRAFGPLQGPRAPSDWKKRAPRVFSVEAASSGKGGVFPRRWRDTKRATRPGLASAHPTKGLRPFAGTPDDLGLKKTRSARFEVEAASSRERRRPPLALAGHKTGDEARTRFRPPRKRPLALCRDPGRPRIGKNALRAF